jgi:hypothetical protein
MNRATQALAVLAIWWTLCVAGQATAQPAQGEAEAKAQADEAQLLPVARWFPPMNAVCIPHEGPSWRLGTSFKTIRSYMDEHDVDGPLFYHRAAAVTSEEAPELLVGFIPTTEHEAVSPAVSRSWGWVYAACLRVEGSLRGTAEQHALLRQWAHDHEYESTGALTEVYYPAGFEDPRAPLRDGDLPAPGADRAAAHRRCYWRR